MRRGARSATWLTRRRAAQIHTVTPDPDAAGAVLVGTDIGELWRVRRDAGWALLARGLPMVQSTLPLD
ncbi:MAG TPA: hypothetical protein VL086_17790 [Candidatus Nitrosotalea sp.]|nr:hypothetical protein [Candidatus Nitrosotalea sp.]